MYDNATLDFEYIFIFPDDKRNKFLIRLDSKTLNYIPDKKNKRFEWAKLENEKCKNCTLESKTTPYCPIALNLLDILPTFVNANSFEKVNVMVKTLERTYSAKTSVQNGLSSMLGIYMVTSGCPIMSKLKPMVRHHLPFATVEETVFRAASAYLLGQYFKHKKGQKADLDLKGLIKIYNEIQKVNLGMADRLRSLRSKDANINALIILDVFAKELPSNIEQSLKLLEYLFEEV
jgi:hypothetical protein